MEYIRCRNCGRYLSTEQLIQGGYCSEDCSNRFLACTTCGRYFQIGKGHLEQYCCPDCSIQYRINRFEATTPAGRLAKELM